MKEATKIFTLILIIVLFSSIALASTSIKEITEDELGISTNNTEHIRINSNGSVGIGTSNPQARIQVDGSSMFNTSSGVLNITGVGSESSKLSSTGALHLTGGGAERGVIIDSNNQVGIGTDNPRSDLEIYNKLRVSNDRSGNTVFLKSMNDSDVGHRLRFGGSSGDAVNVFEIQGINDEQMIRINDTNTNKISLNGNVGIGTNNPNDKLHVVAKQNSSLHETKLIDAVIQGKEGRLQLAGEDREDGSAGLILTDIVNDSNNRHWNIYHHTSKDTPKNYLSIGYKTTSNDGQDTFTGSEIMALTPNKGNVGIGTTNPSSRTEIHVSGSGNSALDVYNANVGSGTFIINARSDVGTVLSARSNGNVGIGTSNPQTPLDVIGEIKARNGIDLDQTNSNCNSNNRGVLDFREASSGNDDKLYTCMKDSSDSYVWVLVARGG